MASIVVIPERDSKLTKFPTAGDVKMWQQSSDVQIEIPESAIIDNRDRGFTRIVFFTYNHLEQILQPRKNGVPNPEAEEGRDIRIQPGQTQVINSKIVSASLGQGRHIQLPDPVLITFQLLLQENVTNPVCVFWDFTTR